MVITLKFSLNYESMLIYLQETWKIQNKITNSSTIYYIFKVYKLSFNIKLSKINWIYREVEGYSGLSQVTLVVKNLPANAGDTKCRFNLCLGKIPGGGNSNPLQNSCLENPMDRGVWLATVHGVTKSQIWLKQLRMHAHTEGYSIYLKDVKYLE